MMTNTQGDVVWRHRFAPFGKTIDLDEDVDNDGQKVTLNLRFPGQYYDEESGLHYNWHRYYDPEIGRYIVIDPLVTSNIYNFNILKSILVHHGFYFNYLFGFNSPILNSDPTGRSVTLSGLVALGAGTALATGLSLGVSYFIWANVECGQCTRDCITYWDKVCHDEKVIRAMKKCKKEKTTDMFNTVCDRNKLEECSLRCGPVCQGVGQGGGMIVGALYTSYPTPDSTNDDGESCCGCN